MNLTIIVAISENNIIGIKNKIPWHIKEDMLRFKELTLNHPVIMGRKTYESFPPKFRPLPERKNIVLSKTLNPKKGIYIARNIERALELTGGKDSYIIGGEKIYELFLPITDKIELTRIYNSYEGDIFFPKISWNEWKLIKEEKRISKKEKISYSFLTYIKNLNQQP